MQYRTITDIPKAEAEALAVRLNQLENEHISNKSALAVAQALPLSDESAVEVARLQANLEVIETVHAKISKEYDSLGSPVEGVSESTAK